MRRILVRAAGVAGLMLAASPLALAGPTLTTITVDGDMGDWAAVLANRLDTVSDGPGEGLTDADAPSSRRLDVDEVAFTWDATYLYFYIHRQGSGKELDHFWIQLDLDNDGFVADNAPLLSIAWRGSDRKVIMALDAYKAANATTGDRITSASGAHDGYRLPGSRAAGAAIETLDGGSASGLEMETRVAWASLAVPAGTAFRWHLSSSRRVGDYPAAIADNTGGSAAFAGLDLGPDRAATTLPGSFLALAHNVRNRGGVVDTFDLSWTSSGPFAPSLVNFYLDADDSGTLTPGDMPLTDTNHNGPTDTGSMAAGAGPKAILAVAQIPYSAVKGQTCTITIKARSSADATVSDTAIDTVTIAQPTITLLEPVFRPCVVSSRLHPTGPEENRRCP